MKPLPQHGLPEWPPLIPSSRAPWWVRVRDLVLTLMAWLALLWELRRALLELVAVVDPAAAASGRRWLAEHLGPVWGRVAPPTPEFRQDLLVYAYVALALMLWLALWALWNRKKLQRRPRSSEEPALPRDTQPAALSTIEQFADDSVLQPEPQQWHQARCLHLSFDNDGRVTRMVDRAGVVDSRR